MCILLWPWLKQCKRCVPLKKTNVAEFGKVNGSVHKISYILNWFRMYCRYVSGKKNMCMCGPWPYHYTPQHVSIVCWRYRGICSPNMSQPEAIQDEKIVVCKQICLCGLCGLCCSWTWISLLLVSFSVGFLVPKALDSRVVCHSPMFIGILVRTSLVGGLEHFLFSIIYGIILPID